MSARRWCFTINNPTAADDPAMWDVSYCKWQKEQGAEGTEHYQGYVELAKAGRLSALKKINDRAHWEKCNGTQEQNIAYCSKEEGRLDGPWEKGEKKQQGKRSDLEAACATAQEEGIAAVRRDHATEYAKYMKGLSSLADEARILKNKESAKRKFDDVELRPWQAALVQKVLGPKDPRKIHWYWEDEGNVGKTYLAKYLKATQGAAVLDCSKKADLTYLLRSHQGDTVLFNITRSVTEEYMQHVYALCESIKDDLVISTKYETCDLSLGDQHVIVFANREPSYDKWSSDRYDVININPTTPFNVNRVKGPNPNPNPSKKTKTTKCPNGCADDEPCFCAQSARTGTQEY